MKRFLTVFMAVILLSGCGGGKTEQLEESAETGRAQVTEDGRKEPIEGVKMELQRPVYDPSLDEYTYLIYNGSAHSVSYGESYGLEKQTEYGWQKLNLREHTGTAEIAYILQPGETGALTCGFDLFREKPERGRYRLVKDVEGQTLYAEFELGSSLYTGDAPYGYAPMETLPESYDAADGAADGAVTFTDRGSTNTDRILEFLRDVSRGIPAQLRTVQEYSEGTPMVIDAIYEENRFCWRVRSDGAVYDQYLSYAVTDGTSVFLSNGADWETAKDYLGRELVHLIPEGTAGMEEAVQLVSDMTEKRLETSSVRYQTWSGDGVWSGALTDRPDELLVSGPQREEAFYLKDGSGKPSEITELSWQEDGVLMVYCLDKARMFNPEQWELSQ